MIAAAGFEGTTHPISSLSRPEVAHVRDATELDTLLDAPNDWHAILLGPAIADPVELARRIRARVPDLAILVLAEPQAAPRIQHALILAPMRGPPVGCVPLDANAPRALDQHLRQASLRRRQSQLLQGANAALAVPRTATPRAPSAMEQLMEAAPIPLLLVDPEGKIIHRNKAARALRPDRAATLADTFADARAEIVTELLAPGDMPRQARRVRWRERSYDIIASPLVVPPALHARLIILDDVTDLVRAEEAQRAEAELHATLLLAQSDLGEGLFFLEKRRIRYANDALARMLRRPREWFPETDALEVVAPEERERVRAIHERRARGDAAPDVYETIFVNAEGERFPVEVSARSLRQGQATLILVRDIRRRREMQTEVEKARASLAQMDKLATIGSLVSGLAHEIRTPLAAIVNEAHLIERQVTRALASPDPRAGLANVQERVQALDSAVDRIQRLMRDMRAFMRGEVPRLDRLTVDPCVEEAVRFFGATQRGNVRIGTRLGSSGEIEADPAQLQQIVINLLQNAADASPSGGEVTVETRDEQDEVVVAVIDQGSGIPPDIKERIFDAFVTTKGQGSGLGLTIVRRLVEVHRARVVLESEVGKGTRFEVRFPCARKQPGGQG